MPTAKRKREEEAEAAQGSTASADNSAAETWQCGICLEETPLDAPVDADENARHRVGCCRASFHVSCLLKWAGRDLPSWEGSTCPNCKAQLPTRRCQECGTHIWNHDLCFQHHKRDYDPADDPAGMGKTECARNLSLSFSKAAPESYLYTRAPWTRSIHDHPQVYQACGPSVIDNRSAVRFRTAIHDAVLANLLPISGFAMGSGKVVVCNNACRDQGSVLCPLPTSGSRFVNFWIDADKRSASEAGGESRVDIESCIHELRRPIAGRLVRVGIPFFWSASVIRRQNPGEFFPDGGKYFDETTTIADIGLQPGDVLVCGIIDHDSGAGILGGAPGTHGGRQIQAQGAAAVERFGDAFGRSAEASANAGAGAGV